MTKPEMNIEKAIHDLQIDVNSLKDNLKSVMAEIEESEELNIESKNKFKPLKGGCFFKHKWKYSGYIKSLSPDKIDTINGYMVAFICTRCGKSITQFYDPGDTLPFNLITGGE